MNKRIVIEQVQVSDRNIVLHFDKEKLVGINWYQGMGDMTLLTDYLGSDPKLMAYLESKFPLSLLTEQYLDRDDCIHFLNSPDYDGIINWIDNMIWSYLRGNALSGRLLLALDDYDNNQIDKEEFTDTIQNVILEIAK